MDEYIKREEALRIVDRRVDLNEKTRHVFQELMSLPAADVAPVVYAEPVMIFDDPFTGRRFTTCSHCDGKIGKRDRYCKHCGAKMDHKQQKEED